MSTKKPAAILFIVWLLPKPTTAPTRALPPTKILVGNSNIVNSMLAVTTRLMTLKINRKEFKPVQIDESLTEEMERTFNIAFDSLGELYTRQISRTGNRSKEMNNDA